MVDWARPMLRSLLFVPGSEQRKIDNARTCKSDAVVVDLEDAVALNRKAAARSTTRESISQFHDNTLVAVRVNSITTGMLEDDLAAVVVPGLDAVMVPKIDDPDSLRHMDEEISQAERAVGLAVGTVRLFVIIETPLGVSRCEAILGSPPARVYTCMFGLGDFTAALGVDLTPDATELWYARSRLAVAARAGGLAPPIDGPWIWLNDNDGLRTDSVRSRQMGYQGRAVLHPRQVGPAVEVYSALTPDEISIAQRIVREFEAAEAQGIASIAVGDRFVDYPMYRVARERLARFNN